MISHMMIRKGIFLMKNFNTIFLTRNLMIILFPIARLGYLLGYGHHKTSIDAMPP
tara:strand:+ start:262 stop:426 length:165 start_codon:yes stop_codon:yes gene_type:complete